MADFEKGHIPGSKHFPVNWVLKGEMLPAEERRKLFEEAGVDLSKDICLTCNSGVTASAVYTALEGISSGQNSMYDGSWQEWAKQL